MPIQFHIGELKNVMASNGEWWNENEDDQKMANSRRISMPFYDRNETVGKTFSTYT